MGLSSKQVHGDEGLDWSESLVKEMECLPKPGSTTRRQQQQQQQQPSEALDCPRCGSKNTKFCYYNNYNKSQPRHFCKACKRHWTKGGTLRNVPVGGGRKNKRLKAAAAANSDSVGKKNNNINIVHHHQHLRKKNISDILYQALIKGSDDHPTNNNNNNNNNNNGSLLFPLPIMPTCSSSEDQQNHQFSLFSSLTPFDDSNNMVTPSTIPTFHPSFIINDEDDDFYDGKKLLDGAVESSTITTTPAANNTSSIFCQQAAWQQQLGPTTEMQNYCWNWNVDIDTLVSADDQHLNIPLTWDDSNTDMKP